jgi:hypothetical protein
LAEFSIVTTCKPSKNIDEFLNFNELINCSSFYNWQCVVLNSKSEIPSELIRKGTIIQKEPDSLLPRPVLNDFLNSVDSEWLIIANSDVWVHADWELILDFMECKDIKFASSQRFDLPENMRISDCKALHPLPLREICSVAKKQSMRTLDIFIINKKALEIYTLLNKEIGILVPGTVGFDNNIIGLLSNIFFTADLTPIIHVFHTNHEPFRKVYRRNHIINLGNQLSFIQERNQQRVLLTTKGCLTFADYRLTMSKNTLDLSKKKFKQIRYYIESVRVKVVNKIDILLNNINRRIFLFLDNHHFFFPTMHMIFGIIFVFPRFRKFNMKFPGSGFDEMLTDYLNKKVINWKQKLLNKIQ